VNVSEPKAAALSGLTSDERSEERGGKTAREAAEGERTNKQSMNYQVVFDDGHQQRYLPDRQSVVRYVLAVGPRAASTRFEVFTSRPAAAGGRTFALAEVIDLARPGEIDRLRAELVP
jgi:hypothetical protein